jgi:hypothetical protein
MKRGPFLQYGVLILGISISAIAVIAFPDFYHRYDVGIFVQWAKAWTDGWTQIFLTCTDCNYPIVGIIGSAGIFKLLDLTGVQNAEWVFRFVMAFIDGINVILVFLLLRELSIKHAALWAGITGMLISTWAGTSVWGQLEGISQCFLLLTVLWVIYYNVSKRIHFMVYLVVGSLLLSLLLLVKQTTAFSFVCLELMLVGNILFRRKWPSGIGYSALQLGLLGLFIFMWDVPLNVAPPDISHLQVVWGERSDTGSTLSGSGVNLWTFLNQRMESPSGAPLPFAANTVFEKILTPHKIGGALFLILAAILTASMLLFLRKKYSREGAFLDRETLLNFILYMAVANLIFNVVWTGAHERWLHHFYPFLLIAYLGLRDYDKRFSDNFLILILGGSTIYGLFVLRVIGGMISGDYFLQRCLSGFHLGFLVYVFYFTLQHQGFTGNVKAFIREGLNLVKNSRAG